MAYEIPPESLQVQSFHSPNQCTLFDTVSMWIENSGKPKIQISQEQNQQLD